MSNIVLQVPAKLNLGLEILQKRKDGFHDIKTIFCQVTLFDKLEVSDLGEDKIEIFSKSKEIPLNESNTVWKIVSLLKEKFGVKKGVRIVIEKNIPTKAGLGGGTGDAAETLKYLDKHWNLNLNSNDLLELSLFIGSDVYYQLIGGVQVGEGRGEKLTELTSLTGIDVVIVKPSVGVETKWAYENVDYSVIGKGRLEGLISAISQRNIFEIAKNLHNDFEYWVAPKHPQILFCKEKIIKYGALGSIMTGSGSGVFGIFENYDKANEAYKSLKRDGEEAYLVKII